MALNLPQVDGLMPNEADWLGQVIADTGRAGRDVPDPIDEDKIRILDTAARYIVNKVRDVQNLGAGYPWLEALERIGAEVVKISVRSSIEPTTLLRKIARDFDRGDEQGEYAQILEDIKRGGYATRVM